MSMSPDDRKNWLGFLDLLQPPPGYRLGAALGTTFGLSMDALTAALLAMSDADGEELAANPVAATMAITRMCDKVRVLVHPATTTGPPSNSGSNRFIAMLDRLVVEVQPASGLFHPKVWALRFEHIGKPKDGTPAAIGRVLVGSRNLTRSTSFELGAAFEGVEMVDGDEASELSGDVARALREWLTATKVRYPEAVWRLPRFVSRLGVDPPHEAKDSLRLRWQGMGQKSLWVGLPNRLEKAVVVSPFIQPDFVTAMLDRTSELRVVSLPESLDALPDETIAALDARAEAQGSPVLYQVTDHGNPDDAHIDGVHAKLMLVEDFRQRSATFVGSANATGPGWGLAGPANVEAMIEMRPGIGLDRFVHGFIRENKTKVHPWVSEYDRTAKPEENEEREAERHLLAALREVAKLDIVLKYDARQHRLSISRSSKKHGLPPWVSSGGVKFSLSPFMLAAADGGWRSISELDGPGFHFDDVPLAKVSAFVALRGQRQTPPMERQRFVLARLEVDPSLLDERDQQLRADIMATADPAMVLSALVSGLSRISTSDMSRPDGPTRRRKGLRDLMSETTLERLLQAVAVDPGLVTEVRLLLGPSQGAPLLKLCDDLDEVTKRVLAGVES